jgi:dipeptidyl aminopeptidase/acylaminoacyl peptidase
LLGGVRDGAIDPRLERMASPAHHVDPSDPPLLVFHGDQDQTVLLDQSERIIAAYEQAGLNARLITIENAGHGGKEFFVPAKQQLVREFLKTHQTRARQ